MEIMVVGCCTSCTYEVAGNVLLSVAFVKLVLFFKWIEVHGSIFTRNIFDIADSTGWILKKFGTILCVIVGTKKSGFC